MFIEKIIEVDHNANISGTSLVGHITISYDRLVEAFGEPTYKAEDEGGFEKVWTEWDLNFVCQDDDGDEDCVKATIYDWKEDGPNASRDNPKYRWHIGGNGSEAEEAIEMFLEKGLN